MGEMPEWYPVVKAAQYLRVPPWELLERPSIWVDLAMIAMSAEAHAREQKSKNP